MDWTGDIPAILLAVVCGAVIGIERQFKHKPAGLRTNIMICLGAAVFTLISERWLWTAMILLRESPQGSYGVGFLTRRGHPGQGGHSRPDDRGDDLAGGEHRYGLRRKVVLPGGHYNGSCVGGAGWPRHVDKYFDRNDETKQEPLTKSILRTRRRHRGEEPCR